MNLQLGTEVPVYIFSSALTNLGGSPSQNVMLITVNGLNTSDRLNSLIIKDTGDRSTFRERGLGIQR